MLKPQFETLGMLSISSNQIIPSQTRHWKKTCGVQSKNLMVYIMWVHHMGKHC